MPLDQIPKRNVSAPVGSSNGNDSLLSHLRHSSSQRASRRPSRSTSKAATILNELPTISKSFEQEVGEGFKFGPSGSTFRLGRTIGAGGSSIVYEGYALNEGNKRVAVKVMLPKSTLGNEHKNEVDIWKQLPQHPHLLALLYHEPHTNPVSTHNEEKGHEYLVMEYSQYGNLYQLIRNEGIPNVASPLQERSRDAVVSPLTSSRHSSLSNPRSRGIPLHESRCIMRQLAAAMRCLHTVAHVVHNDLKLENILGFPMDDDQNNITWKIADFGLAERVISDEAPSNTPPTPCGTMEYIAPEMVRYLDTDMEIFDKVPSHAKPLPPPDLSPYARDMWALGCILYVLCTGFLPFTDGVQSRLLQRISDGEYELPYRLLTEKERAQLPAESLNEDPEDTDECRNQAREVLEHLLDVDPYTRWDIEDLCQSRWLAL